MAKESIEVLQSWLEIVQGSILGLILYAIFISPIFDIDYHGLMTQLKPLK